MTSSNGAATFLERPIKKPRSTVISWYNTLRDQQVPDLRAFPKCDYGMTDSLDHEMVLEAGRRKGRERGFDDDIVMKAPEGVGPVQHGSDVVEAGFAEGVGEDHLDENSFFSTSPCHASELPFRYVRRGGTS